MKNRLCALLAAAVPGLLFLPVFGPALLRPVGAVVVASFAVVELCARAPRSASWRPLLVVLAGLAALVGVSLRHTTAAGLPTAATWEALREGALDSWRLTLESTWPADPSLALFVPLAVLAAAVIGVELLRFPLLALLPGLLLLVLSQAYEALRGTPAVVGALAYAAVAGLSLLRAGRALPAVPAVAVVAVAALLFAGTGGPGEPSTLRSDHVATPPAARVVNPLDELAGRQGRPDVPVFTYTSAARVDRWREVVLNAFDGVTWRTTGSPRRFGAALPAPHPAAGSRSAEVRAAGTWLPSRPFPASVRGAAVLVDEESGVLRNLGEGTATYTLTWWEPTATDLIDAALDVTAPGRVRGVGRVPEEVRVLAGEAVGHARPSMRTALDLERFLGDGYRRAEAPDLPTGSGWPQLRNFLLTTRVGAPEQFAAAYVAMAAVLGIPARLVVGYRSPAASGGRVVVRSGHATAWPEVAVAGVGWVALDPGDTSAPTSSTGLEAATTEARAKLEPHEHLSGRSSPAAAAGITAARSPAPPLALVLLASALPACLAGVPLLTAARRWRRRRGRGAAAIVGAWSEARDRLRAHGIAVTAAMTPRDVAALPDLPAPVRSGLTRLASSVDAALWSGGDAGSAEEAWSAVGQVRAGLASAPLLARVRAAVDPRQVIGR